MTEKPFPSRDLDKVVVRLPDGLRDRLADVAKANKRSTNAEIVARLEDSLASENILVLPPDLAARIERAARIQGRSMSAEARMNLEMCFPPEASIEDLIFEMDVLINQLKTDYPTTASSISMRIGELKSRISEIAKLSEDAVVRRAPPSPSPKGSHRGKKVAK